VRSLAYLWFVVAAITAGSLFFLSAPYGRHARAGWGPSIAARVGWIAMELPAALTIAIVVALDPPHEPAPYVLLSLWEVHYIYRALIFPLRMRSGRMPIAIPALAVFFNVVNGVLNGSNLTHATYAASWLVDPRFLVGAVIFFTGFAINLWADAALRALRAPGETAYKIPRGGLYELVSCPNYLGEIIEWTGWAVLTWSLAGASFAVWTFANLAPRAWTHHRWYRDRFPDYPRSRHALIPYVW